MTRAEICDLLGCDLPILAFSHCRDVVAAVTNAGGFGVLGGSSYHADELDQELRWIDQQVHGRPYGVDLVIPARLESRDKFNPARLLSMIPTEHVAFAASLLAEHGVTPPTKDEREAFVPAPIDQAGAAELLDVAFTHPIGLVASALGIPPASLVDRAKREGVVCAALVGTKDHAIKQVEAGVDVIVAQGYEAGGHVGEVATMVLVPEVVDAVAALGAPPVLAAGGIVTGRQVAAALALGAAGVWCGSVWLTTFESSSGPNERRALLKAGSSDTIRSKSRSGKYSRGLRSAWTQGWGESDSPDPLPMPLQFAVSQPALAKVFAAADAGDQRAAALATYWVGQGVGMMNSERSVGDVMFEMAQDMATAMQHLADLLDG
jgi:NAD(P)H-dependent flavin oxidoreductase YrpB (nitropropane dioxygenase family)